MKDSRLRVSIRRSLIGNRVWLLSVFLLLVLLTFLLPWHGRHTRVSLPKSIQTPVDYQEALQANLNHLSQLRYDHSKQVVKKFKPIAQPREVVQLDKVILLRQNAPTNVYAHAIVKPDEKISISNQAILNDQGANSHFVNRDRQWDVKKATRLQHPRYVLAVGEFLHAVLETAINSQLPGMVRAVLSRPAYSYLGERVLMPAGTRLIGQYRSSILHGQNRVLVVWQQALLPNGVIVSLASPGAGALGRAGQAANVIDRHFVERFGQAALLSVLGVGAATAGVSDTAQYNSAAQYRTALTQSLQQSASHSLSSPQFVGPTLHVYQGEKIVVFVAHNISFFDVRQ